MIFYIRKNLEVFGFVDAHGRQGVGLVRAFEKFLKGGFFIVATDSANTEAMNKIWKQYFFISIPHSSVIIS